MQRGLVGSEMCIRDRYQRRVHGIMNKILVTGISGFLGSQIAFQLLNKGIKVRGTVRDKKNVEKMQVIKELPHPELLEICEADLVVPHSFDEAAMGCDGIIHPASPFPLMMPEDESLLIKPAVEGTLQILNAAAKSGTVRSVVITSSAVAMVSYVKEQTKVLTEEDWAEDEHNGTYSKSKVLAEKAAWDFYKDMGAEKKFRLAVINPAFILGPSLIKTDFTSSLGIKMLLKGEMKKLPRLFFAVVDVRDAAAAHIEALLNPASDGQRYICFSGEYLWMEEMAKILREEYGSSICNEVFESCPVSDPKHIWTIRWGKSFALDNSKIKKELGITFRPAKESVLSLAKSLIDLGLVTKPPKQKTFIIIHSILKNCLLYTSPSPRDLSTSRMPSSA
eukprot:TRINITY_DN908_c0_g1_i1.p1 TRINITY_DN908_c0_g1~~TRINITY_DN908_c0_g1_i1.p1  ORF type:complete len:392 (-),score=78.53 TRINITY_DN908_c0_g1_i1:124-1299(-)